jgi:hypothetical protein
MTNHVNKALVVILFVLVVILTRNLFNKQEPKVLVDYSNYTRKIDSLQNESRKFKQYADSLLAIPFTTAKETIRIKTKREILVLSELNSTELDSTIRSNW